MTPIALNDHTFTDTASVSHPDAQILSSGALAEQATDNKGNPLAGIYGSQTTMALSSPTLATSGWANVSANSINDYGAIVGTATYTKQSPTDPVAAGSHGVMLLPMELDNLTDPYLGTTKNPGHNNQDTRIDITTSTPTSVKSVAWIAAHDPNNSDKPRMPKLQAKIGAPSGCKVLWKLQVIFHDRFGNPHRDFDTGTVQDTAVADDTVTIPPTTAA